VNLRERKQLKARRALEDTAARLFLSKGYEATTVAEIADATDLSPRTFFRYFGSKEDVLFSRSGDHLLAVGDALAGRPADEPDRLSLEHVLIEFGTYLDRSSDRVLPAAQLIARTPELRARRAEEYMEWVRGLAHALAARAGKSSPELREEVLVSAALGAFQAAFDNWTQDPEGRALSSVVREAFEILQLGRAAVVE